MDSETPSFTKRLEYMRYLRHDNGMDIGSRRAILTALVLGHNDKPDYASLSNARLAVSLGFSLTTVSDAIQHLQKVGFIVRELQDDDTRRSRKTLIQWDRIIAAKMSEPEQLALMRQLNHEKSGRKYAKNKRAKAASRRPVDRVTALTSITSPEEVERALGGEPSPPLPPAAERRAIPKARMTPMEAEVLDLLQQTFPDHPTLADPNVSAVITEGIRACLKQAESEAEGLEIFRMGCHAPSLAPDRASFSTSERLGGMLQEGTMFGRWVEKYRAEIRQYRESLSFLCLGGNRVVLPTELRAQFAGLEEWIKRTTAEDLVWSHTEEEGPVPDPHGGDDPRRL